MTCFGTRFRIAARALLNHREKLASLAQGRAIAHHPNGERRGRRGLVKAQGLNGRLTVARERGDCGTASFASRSLAIIGRVGITYGGRRKVAK